jgi:hypothetical protein
MEFMQHCLKLYINGKNTFDNEKFLLSEINIFCIIYLFTCAYIVWVISLLCPPPPPSPHFPPQFQAGPVLPLSLILLKKRDKHNKEDKVFLLVELRIAIQKYY